MTKPEVTTRHAGHALDLLISGAARDIEADFSADQEEARKDAMRALFDKLLQKLIDWEIEGAVVTNMDAMICQMQTEIEEPIKNMRVLELLNEFNLLP